MRFRPSLLLAVPALAGLLVTGATAQIKVVSLVQNLAYPLDVAQPPGDSSRLFIVGQLGTVQILKNGSLLPQPFLDLTGEILFGAEQGLLNLEFDPDYETNGYFYVYFITGTGSGISVIRRYNVSANPDSADENSGHEVFRIPQFTVGHNGATLRFGPDGYLWFGLGESNQAPLAQNPLSLFGKLLRLDPDGDDYPADPDRNYAIPPDNPFVGDASTLDEIWALGLRNPWRFSFDRLTGDLYIGDVGQYAWEEISFEPAGSPGGLNFGWERMEGFACYNPPTNCDDGSLTHPIYSWPHVACNSAVGGYVYRGTELAPWLNGHYFFADYCMPAIWSFRFDPGSGTYSEFTDWSTTFDVDGALKYPASLFEDNAGELYVVEYRVAIGEVWKIVPDPSVVGIAAGPGEGAGLVLSRGAPNPFGRSTQLEVRLTEPGDLEVAVFGPSGRRVRQLLSGRRAGRIALEWHGDDDEGRALPNGVYFVRAKTAAESRSERVTLLR